MDKLVLALWCIAACVCATTVLGKKHHRCHHDGRCTRYEEGGAGKLKSPDKLTICPLNETTCGDDMNMTCTDKSYFVGPFSLVDEVGEPLGVCVKDTIDFEEGAYCCEPGCRCPSGGECSADVVGNFTSNTTGICVGNATGLPEECTNHIDCADPESLCVQGNGTSYCLVPQSRPDEYECPESDSSSSESSSKSSKSSKSSESKSKSKSKGKGPKKPKKPKKGGRGKRG